MNLTQSNCSKRQNAIDNLSSSDLKFSIVVCFAVLTDSDLHKLINCIQSLSIFLQKTNLSTAPALFTILFQGFCEHHDNCLILCNLFINRICNQDCVNLAKIQFTEQNHGKSFNLNTFVQQLKPEDVNYLLYFDGDIDVSSLPGNFCQQIKTAYDLLSNSFDKIGLLTLNQQGDNRHNLLLYFHSKKLQSDDTTLFCPKFSDMLAFGCFVCKLSTLKSFSFESVGSYGPEDTLLAKEMSDQGYNHFLLQDIYVNHPASSQAENEKKKQVLLNYFRKDQTRFSK